MGSATPQGHNRAAIGLLAESVEDRSRRTRRARPSLIEAVAGIVAVAADQARQSGELPALRAAIEAVLDPPAEPEDG